MQSIQTSHFTLSEVKPFEGLKKYRAFCVEAVKEALALGTQHRDCPVDRCALEPWKDVESFEYLRCKGSGSLFLKALPTHRGWEALLKKIAEHRQSSNRFYNDIRKSRLENVYGEKRKWIENTLRIHGISQARAIDLATPPTPWTSFLQESKLLKEVMMVEEMSVIKRELPHDLKTDVAILFESLDRVDAPEKLLQGVVSCLKPGGLLFVTSLVCSGFDFQILRDKNLYLFPPDRNNIFSLTGLKTLLAKAGLELLEVSTPGLLDVEIVKTHLNNATDISLSSFEREILKSDEEVRSAFQTFLQQANLSSFARLVCKKR